jgi:phenylalanyl-tRNA synthetase beta chain
VNVSSGWLSALLGRVVDPREAAELLSLRAVPVDAVQPVHRGLEGILVGLVERVEPHPNADRLTLCLVNDGGRTVQVVCGAPNVTAGRRYPYAPVGTVLPGGLKLEARKIRGVTSHGMLCSARELDLGSDHEGILELVTDAPAGTPLLEALPVADTRLVLDVTPNRPDLLGHRGVARELSAAYGLPIKLPEIPGAPRDVAAPRRVGTRGAVDGLEVAIEDVEGCARYIAAVIRGVTVGPSPAWLQARLLAVGARPINNVVDVTNYILYELNQPLHAFDQARVRGGKILVRRPRPGERVTTLDGQLRELAPGMTMICDAEGPVAIGGVMGGVDSQVTEATRDVVLECAWFDPRRIRETRRALRLSTEASYRFERGTDIQAMPEVVRRAVALLRAVGGGAEREPAVDVYPRLVPPRTVFLRPERVAHVLGTPVAREEIERLLAGVGFAVAPKNGRLAVQIPGWRPDVAREIDLIEEVARLKGYDAFPVELRPFRPSVVPDDPGEALKAALRRSLAGMGLLEARCLPLVPEGGEGAAALLNPLSAEEAYLRQTLLPGLVRSAERNWSARVRDIRLFEIGVVFRDEGEGLPLETLRVGAVVSGARTPPHWSAAGQAADYERWDLKAMFEVAAREAGPQGLIVGDALGWVLLDGASRRRGWAGALEADRPAWAAPLYGFELDIEVREREPARYVPLPTTPPVERDLALLVPAGVTAEQVEAILRDAGGALLESAAVFDEYRGSELGGRRSVAWRLVFRAANRTLRDAEADEALARILSYLKEHVGVERREA